MSRAFFCFYLFLESRADEPSVFGRIGPADLREISPGALCPNLQFASSAEVRGAPHSASSPLATVGKREEDSCWSSKISLSLSGEREGTAACGAPDVRLLCPSRTGVHIWATIRCLQYRYRSGEYIVLYVCNFGLIMIRKVVYFFIGFAVIWQIHADQWRRTCCRPAGNHPYL